MSHQQPSTDMDICKAGPYWGSHLVPYQPQYGPTWTPLFQSGFQGFIVYKWRIAIFGGLYRHVSHFSLRRMKTWRKIPFGKCVAVSLATVVALGSTAAIMTASNDSVALAADAGVEEGGARSGDIGRGAAREEPSSSGAASEKGAELQPPKKKCRRSQRRKALGFRVGYLTKYGLRMDSCDASSGANFFRVMLVLLKIWS
jgi:hypothetical protein